jgi:tRNA-specific 2-thiouridylase
LFPVGELPKPDVRQIAREAELPTHAKKDSTGICFIGERDFREFLGQYIPARKGELQKPDGERVGEHDGVMYYTLGQRNGLGIGGRKDTSNEPWYVVGKDVVKNILFVAQGNETNWLHSKKLSASELSWVAGAAPGDEFACTAKTRYRQVDQHCRVTIHEGECRVEFDEPQRAVTPGQSIVFYRGEECLGGGVIDATDAPFGGGVR